jgi:hypothetical protein
LNLENLASGIVDVRADNETLLAALYAMADSDDISRLQKAQGPVRSCPKRTVIRE